MMRLSFFVPWIIFKKASLLQPSHQGTTPGEQAKEHTVHVSVCHKQTAWMTALQVPKKKKLPSEKTLQQEIVQTLSGVNVLEFNIKMLMAHLSKSRIPPSTSL